MGYEYKPNGSLNSQLNIPHELQNGSLNLISGADHALATNYSN